MTFAFFFSQMLSGLANASTLFLVASGLSIIFGVTRIVNFAHGSFYMLGAYIAFALIDGPLSGLGAFGFWGAVGLSALAVGLIGGVVEMGLLRRLYNSPELFQLLATFGLVLVIQDVTLAAWGPEDLLGPQAPGLEGAVEVFGQLVPQYDLFLIGLGVAVLAGLLLLLHWTRWGILVRAASQDREMTSALGVDQRWLFTSAVILGSILAGLGGALQLPREAANLQMDLSIIVEAFVVVVIGGMGSISGAFLAAILIGLIQAFGIVIFPNATLVIIFLVMAVVLTVRPYGLLGRMEGTIRGPEASPKVYLRAYSPRLRLLAGVGIVALLLVPMIVTPYALILITDILILALFAASLHFLLGPCGMISFGHAAYFGLGAYGAALTVHHLQAPMEVALLFAPLLAGAGALAFGWICVKRSGIYMAMLTLAVAQIIWSTTFQWYSFTGGDNGLLGIWPADWASSREAYFYMTFGLTLLTLTVLRRAIFAPFGYATRASRDSLARAEAIGINTDRHRWMAFGLAGVSAGIAGGLYAFAKGSVFPDLMSIQTSVAALVMVLMGGIQSLTGPIIGAATFHGLESEIARYTDLWRLFLGLTIIAIVLLMPQGLAGAFGRIFGQRLS